MLPEFQAAMWHESHGPDLLILDLELKRRLHPSLNFGSKTRLVFYQTSSNATNFYAPRDDSSGIRQIGSWTKATGLTLIENVKQEPLRGKSLRVATNVSPPFVTGLLEDKSAAGFVPDILKVMTEAHGFEVEYLESFDGYYGTLVNGTWNGLIKMVLDGAVDLVATDLAMTLERSQGQ